MDHQARWMKEALALAEEAAADGEIPVGAVIVDSEGVIIGRGRNRRESGDPLGHAELIAIRQAAEAIGDWRLEGTTMVVTLEPCAMCGGTLGNLVQDARLNHRLDVVSGVEAEESRRLLQEFFQGLRKRSQDTERWQSG